MQRAGIAEQREIGREIKRVEIGAAVGQPLLGDAHRIEAQHLRLGGQIRLQLADQPPGIERRDQHRARAAVGEPVDRRCLPSEHCAAEPRDVLDVDAGDIDIRQPEDLGEPFGGAERIDDRGRRPRRQRGDQRTSMLRRVRVGQRLIKRVAAANIVEGLDAQGHGGRILHRAAWAHSVASVSVASGRRQDRIGGRSRAQPKRRPAACQSHR